MLIAFSACSCLTIRLEGAVALTKGSDVESSQALVGTWELKVEQNHPPTDRVFLSFDPRGNFKLIRIIKFLGRRGRQEDEGKWRVSDGELIQEITEMRGYQWTGAFSKRRIVSLHHDLVILRTPVGSKEELRRVSIPSQLPPILQEHELNQALVLVSQNPQYPLNARQQRLEGKGLFVLTVDEKTGVVTSVRVQQSTGYRILDEAAVGTLKTWRLKPQTVDKLRVPIVFSLRRR
jgi:TonB family protein